MDQKLSRFVKFHGALIAFSALGSTMRWAPWMDTTNYLARLDAASTGSDPSWTTEPGLEKLQFALFFVWTVKTFCLFIGLIRENPSLMRTAKWFYLSTFLMQAGLFSRVINVPDLLAVLIVVLAIVTLYIFYVLHVLEHLFVELQRQRQGAILITAITVCEGSTPQQQQHQQQLLAAQHFPSLTTPPQTLLAAAMQHPKADASQPDVAVKAKEFPSWE